MRVPLPLTFLAVIALAAACGGGTPAASTAAPTSTAAGPTATAAGTTTATATATAGGGDGGSDPANVSCNDGVVGTDVAIVDFAFEPAAVTADADKSVHWTNTGSATHTVTFDNGKDCGSLASTELLTVLFLAPGTYPYHCDIHKSMKGTVTLNG